MKVDIETVRYRMKKILKSKIINRFTIILEKPPSEYNIAFFMNFELAPGLMKRYAQAYHHYVDVDEGLPVMNAFQYLALMSGSYLLFGIGCFDSEESAIKHAIMEHKEIYKEDNPEMSYARITRVVRGCIPVRSVDMQNEYVPIEL